ncbi:MAG: primosomal protein N' [Alphaproteobacteria bacterium]|nr:primosomal protein N' [Alphaproteobacteria bacterium]
MAQHVLLPMGLDQAFTYALPDGVDVGDARVGQLVFVPFRKKTQLGVIWGTDESAYAGTVKEIESLTPFCLPPLLLDFIDWVAKYTMNPRGMILKMVLALPLAEFQKLLRAPPPCPPVYRFDQPVLLSPAQKEAADFVIKSAGKSQPILLDGVTGSGKTEVYLSAIEDVLKRQDQALVLLPEIGLTTQWLKRFEDRFGYPPHLWHSDISLKQKRLTWQRTLAGDSIVVVGARSSLFLPFSKLGLIVVDEEHDPSYKQEDQTIYHARDMAVVRAHLSKIPVILASATPSLESFSNAQKGRYHYLTLGDRFAGAMLPSVSVVDMRQQHKAHWISAPIFHKINDRLLKKEQTLLFLNRRGYAPLTLCRECGHRFMCPACASWLVLHKIYHNSTENLRCHHCDYYQPLPKVCPQCEKADCLTICGPGVERIYEEVQKRFPQARTLLAASDHVSTAKEMKAMIEQIQNHEADIIIGTQMLAKGHHFPKLTLVGVIDADMSLNGGDLRAGERTYQLLHQVAGRAGREKHAGEVLLQTFHPDHPIMQALKNSDREQFYACELQERQVQTMPPFGRLAAVILSCLDNDMGQQAAHKLFRTIPAALPTGVSIFGPVPAPLARLKGRYRWRFLIQAPRSVSLQPILQHWLQSAGPISQTVRVSIDIDPQSFL